MQYKLKPKWYTRSIKVKSIRNSFVKKPTQVNISRWPHCYSSWTLSLYLPFFLITKKHSDQKFLICIEHYRCNTCDWDVCVPCSQADIPTQLLAAQNERKRQRIFQEMRQIRADQRSKRNKTKSDAGGCVSPQLALRTSARHRTELCGLDSLNVWNHFPHKIVFATVSLHKNFLEWKLCPT